MLHTAHSMSQRLGVMLLLAAVTLSSVVTCPRKVVACSMAQRTMHDCCKQRTTLRNNDCCCQPAHQLTAQAVSTFPQDENVPIRLAVTLFQPVFSPIDASRMISTAAAFGHGSDPPDTPITQHTLLLL